MKPDEVLTLLDANPGNERFVVEALSSQSIAGALLYLREQITRLDLALSNELRHTRETNNALEVINAKLDAFGTKK